MYLSDSLFLFLSAFFLGTNQPLAANQPASESIKKAALAFSFPLAARDLDRNNIIRCRERELAAHYYAACTNLKGLVFFELDRKSIYERVPL